MKHLFSRIILFELAKIKSNLVVEVSVQTKPNNELINIAVLGIIGSSIGGVVNTLSGNEMDQKVSLNFKHFVKIYTEIITPSISDDGNVHSIISADNLSVVYGSCNNFIRIFPKLADIAGIEYTNIAIITRIKYTKGGGRFNKVAAIIIKEELFI